MASRRERFAERRVAQGYSQEDFAEALAVAASTVVRWESGRATPRPHQRPKIAGLLGVTLPELEALLSEEQPAETAALPDNPPLQHGDDDDMKRREVLGLLAVTGALVTLPDSDGISRGRTASALLEAGDDLHRSLWKVYALSDSKQAVFPAVRGQLDTMSKGLAEARTSTERARLCRMTADLYQLVGELFFDANRYTDAASYTLAAHAAHAGGDHDLWACAMTRHAYVELYARRAPAAQPLLTAAARVAQAGDGTLSTRHWVAAVQAQVYAAMGDLDACNRALDEAEEVHALDGKCSHNGGWLRFDGSRLAEERGACYLRLGRPDLAEEALVAALAQPLSLRRRAAVLSDLAALGAYRRDADQVMHYAEQALGLADRSHSGFIGRKLDGLRGSLAPLMADDRVSGLDHRIAALPRTA
ncbi:transcriptional regulator with XRE-family HTH domain [Streptomyces sp. SAI-170]|uniref:helix-turn-helix domain-containing protein n=1 Tax=Streptomyces sp. SAI-170 TaxID=3377729 RepID=UPI003C7D0A6C